MAAEMLIYIKNRINLKSFFSQYTYTRKWKQQMDLPQAVGNFFSECT